MTWIMQSMNPLNLKNSSWLQNISNTFDDIVSNGIKECQFFSYQIIYNEDTLHYIQSYQILTDKIHPKILITSLTFLRVACIMFTMLQEQKTILNSFLCPRFCNFHFRRDTVQHALRFITLYLFHISECQKSKYLQH